MRARIDLREVQRDIEKLARDEVQRQDFYRLHTVGGRWKPCAPSVQKPTHVPVRSSGNSASFTPSDDQAARESLTAAFLNVPVEHNGKSEFHFQVAFSEDIANSYRTLRDESFAVTGGMITDARRSDGRNDLWVIAVRPDSYEAVTITLPGGRACDTSGAVCTGGATARRRRWPRVRRLNFAR